MAFQYCTECGHKMTFTINKPKFCSGCGLPLEKEAQAAQQSPVRAPAVRNLNTAAASSQETSVDELPDISELQYDIELDGRAIRLGDVIGTSVGGPPPVASKISNATAKPRSQKEIIAESTAQCGSSRSTNIDAEKA